MQWMFYSYLSYFINDMISFCANLNCQHFSPLYRLCIVRFAVARSCIVCAANEFQVWKSFLDRALCCCARYRGFIPRMQSRINSGWDNSILSADRCQRLLGQWARCHLYATLFAIIIEMFRCYFLAPFSVFLMVFTVNRTTRTVYLHPNLY